VAGWKARATRVAAVVIDMPAFLLLKLAFGARISPLLAICAVWKGCRGWPGKPSAEIYGIMVKF
jgi:hypothetical protein